MERVTPYTVLERYARGEREFQDLFIQGEGLRGKSIARATFEQVTFHEVDFTEADLQQITLQGVVIEYARLQRTNMSGATLQGVTMRGTELEETNLSGATLQGITFDGLDTAFPRANLRGARMQEIRLNGYDFTEANLEGAFLAHAQLQGATFRGANLQRADLTAANLRGADLRGAELRQAILREAILENTQRDAQTNFQGARYRSRVIADRHLLQELTRRTLEAEGEEQQPVMLSGRPLKISMQVAKEKIQEAIHGRPGQQQFRTKMLEAYAGRCAITGCNIEPLLQAAHIVPYCLDPRNSHPSNGILLRADLHTLFDLNYVEIDPHTGCVYLHQQLQQDPLYRHLCQQQVVVSPPLLHLPQQLWIYGNTERRWRQNLEWRRDHYQEFLEP